MIAEIIHLDELAAGREARKRHREYLRNRLNGECAYCGCTPLFLTLDHIVPRFKGGETIDSNLAPACSDCNASKGSQDVWQWWQSRSDIWCEIRAARVRRIMRNTDIKKQG